MHYVLADGPNKGAIRPAIIVRTWGGTTVQLQVFTDSGPAGDSNDCLPQVMWKTSVTQKEPDPATPDTVDYFNTWRWPPRS